MGFSKKTIKIIKGVIIYSLLIFIGMSFSLTSCLTNRSAKEFKKNEQNKPYEAIIVPGYPFEGEEWNDVMKMRVLWSVKLFKQGIAKNIIYSGSAVYSPYVESKIMKIYAMKLGVPEENLFTEEKAEHSTENIYYSFQLAKDLGFNKIALSTDPFQTAMLKSFVRKKHLSIDYLPIVMDQIENMDSPAPVIDPTPAFVNEFTSIKERQGFFERLRGTMGKNINEESD